MFGPNIQSSWPTIISIMNSRLLEFIMKSLFSSSQLFQKASLALRYGSCCRSHDIFWQSSVTKPLIDVGSRGFASSWVAFLRAVSIRKHTIS